MDDKTFKVLQANAIRRAEAETMKRYSPEGQAALAQAEQAERDKWIKWQEAND